MLNKTILLGRITKDPELKSTPNGVSVCSFTVAVNRRFKNSNGNYDADFINCIAWRNTAEFISKHFKKGSMIGVVGSLQTRVYEKDGQKRYITEVVAEEAYFAGGQTEAKTNTAQNDDVDGFMEMPDDSDLPF